MKARPARRKRVRAAEGWDREFEWMPLNRGISFFKKTELPELF